MPKPLRVFLCHSSNDKPIVRELYLQLRREDWIDPWLDEEEIFPGMDWDLEIEKAVEAADAILVCLSKGSITKEGYVQRELRIVLDYAKYKPEGTLYIFPVRLDASEMPRRLRHLQYTDYFPTDNRDWAYGRLLVSLRNRAKALGIVTGTAEEPRRADRNHLSDDETIRPFLARKQVVTMPRQVYDQILDHAQGNFPNMAVGYLLGKEENNVTAIIPLSNANKTSSRTKFRVTPEDYLQAELVADRDGLSLIGLFYSQDAGAGISETTREWAQPFFIYLVIGLATHPPSRRVYRLTEDRKSWIEYELSVG